MTAVIIGDIQRDADLQPRAMMNMVTVEEYREALAAGDDFPPVTVFSDGERYYLADGFHRVAAVEALGWRAIEANVHQGTKRDAILWSVKANSAHGLRRSDADKRKAVLTLLEDPEWAQWSDREIARATATSHPFVAQMRGLTGNVTSERQYRDRHGNVTVMDTSGITAAAAAAATAAAQTRMEDRLALEADLHAAVAELDEEDQVLVGSLVSGGLSAEDRYKEWRAALLKCSRKAVELALVFEVEHLGRDWAMRDLDDRITELHRGNEAPAEAGEPDYAPVWMLENAVRARLGRLDARDAAPANQIRVLENLRAHPQQAPTYLGAALPEQYRQGDLRQALNNVLDQVRQELRRADMAPASVPGDEEPTSAKPAIPAPAEQGARPSWLSSASGADDDAGDVLSPARDLHSEAARRQAQQAPKTSTWAPPLAPKPAIPAPGQTATTAARDYILTLRITPNGGDVLDCKTMVSIGEEGKGPLSFWRGLLAESPRLLRAALGAALGDDAASAIPLQASDAETLMAQRDAEPVPFPIGAHVRWGADRAEYGAIENYNSSRTTAYVKTAVGGERKALPVYMLKLVQEA